MSELNSLDLVGCNLKLQKLALKYNLKGSVKFTVDVWKYSHIDHVVITYSCGYVDMNSGSPISESISRENLGRAFSEIEKYFSKLNSEAIKN